MVAFDSKMPHYGSVNKIQIPRLEEPISNEVLERLRPHKSHALPKVRQLYLNLHAAIERGELSFDTRLPATRRLATILGVGRNTVTEAYEQLASEGLLVADGRLGTRVVRQRPVAGDSKTEWFCSSRARKSVSSSIVYREFAPGEPDTALFPAKAWRQAMIRASGLHGDQLGYHAQSSATAQRAIARYLATYRSLIVDPEQIIITASTRQSLALAAMLYAEPGDTAWSESPGYPGAVDAFQQFGLKVLPCKVDRYGLVPPEHSEPPRLVYLTPCFQYPMGMSLGVDRRDALLQLSQNSGCVLFEDDYDSEFRDDTQPRPALAADSRGARVLHAGTFSKILFPAVRVAWMVVPHDSVEVAHRCLKSIGGGNTHIAQAAVTELLENGTIMRHLQHARSVYGQRRRALNTALANSNSFSPLTEITGSLSLVLPLKRSVSFSAVQKVLNRNALGAQPLEGMRWQVQKPSRCSALIVGLGAVDSLAMSGAIKRLDTAITSII